MDFILSLLSGHAGLWDLALTVLAIVGAMGLGTVYDGSTGEPKPGNAPAEGDYRTANNDPDGVITYVYTGDGDWSNRDSRIATVEGRRTGWNSEGDTEEMMALSLEYGKEMIAANVAATKEIAAWNVQNFPKVTGVAMRQALGASSTLNDFMRTEYESALDELYPAWREDMVGAAADAQANSIELTRRFEQNVMPNVLASADRMSAQALATNEAMLRGEISPDVQAAVERSSAELSTQMGVRGQSSQYMTARDLGLTSMQLQQQGLANSQASLGLASSAYAGVNQTLQMPVQTGINASNLIRSYQAPLTDPSQLYAGNVNVLSGAGQISANTAYGTNAQTLASAGSLVQSQAQFNAQRQDQMYWNTMNYNAQMQAASAAQSNSLGSAIGGAAGGGLGLYLGGPMGGMAGASAGSAIGGSF